MRGTRRASPPRSAPGPPPRCRSCRSPGALQVAPAEAHTGGHEAGHDRGGARETRTVAEGQRRQQRRAEAAHEGARGVRALGREAIPEARRSYNHRLREPLAVAAGEEVAPPRAARGDSVMHERDRLVDEATARASPPDAQAELGLLAADRMRTDAADAVTKAAELAEELPAKGHARPDQVPDGCALGRQPPVGAADDPAEFGGEPGRPLFPDRLYRAADAEHMLVVVLARQKPEPIGRSHRIVVEKGHHVAAGEPQTAVARARQAVGFDVRSDHDVRQLGTRAHQDRRIVVDDDDRLERWM